MTSPAPAARDAVPESTRAESIRVMHPLFQTGQGGSIPTSALDLRLYEIDLELALGLNRLWHSRFPRLDQRVAGWICYGAEHQGIWYAVAVWGLPIARLLPQDGTWLELRRLAISPDSPKNSASRLLSVMAKLIGRGNPKAIRLISYQDTESHSGCIYKAAGWVMVDTRKSSTTWEYRNRPDAQSDAPKVRWECSLSAPSSRCPAGGSNP